MGILMEGFTLFILVDRLLTVMVTMSGCIQMQWGYCVCFQTTFWSLCIFQSLVVGLFFWYWNQDSWLWGGHYAKKYALWLLVIPEVCISIGIVINWFGS
jgi:hypothetical protein